MTLAAGREHYLFGGHDSLYARCSGSFRQSLWLGQIGPPPVCKSMSMSNVNTQLCVDTCSSIHDRQYIKTTINCCLPLEGQKSGTDLR